MLEHVFSTFSYNSAFSCWHYLLFSINYYFHAVAIISVYPLHLWLEISLWVFDLDDWYKMLFHIYIYVLNEYKQQQKAVVLQDFPFIYTWSVLYGAVNPCFFFLQLMAWWWCTTRTTLDVEWVTEACLKSLKLAQETDLTVDSTINLDKGVHQ